MFSKDERERGPLRQQELDAMGLPVENRLQVHQLELANSKDVTERLNSATALLHDTDPSNISLALSFLKSCPDRRAFQVLLDTVRAIESRALPSSGTLLFDLKQLALSHQAGPGLHNLILDSNPNSLRVLAYHSLSMRATSYLSVSSETASHAVEALASPSVLLRSQAFYYLTTFLTFRSPATAFFEAHGQEITDYICYKLIPDIEVCDQNKLRDLPHLWNKLLKELGTEIVTPLLRHALQDERGKAGALRILAEIDPESADAKSGFASALKYSDSSVLSSLGHLVNPDVSVDLGLIETAHSVLSSPTLPPHSVQDTNATETMRLYYSLLIFLKSGPDSKLVSPLLKREDLDPCMSPAFARTLKDYLHQQHGDPAAGRDARVDSTVGQDAVEALRLSPSVTRAAAISAKARRMFKLFGAKPDGILYSPEFLAERCRSGKELRLRAALYIASDYPEYQQKAAIYGLAIKEFPSVQVHAAFLCGAGDRASLQLLTRTWTRSKDLTTFIDFDEKAQAALVNHFKSGSGRVFIQFARAALRDHRVKESSYDKIGDTLATRLHGDSWKDAAHLIANLIKNPPTGFQAQSDVTAHQSSIIFLVCFRAIKVATTPFHPKPLLNDTRAIIVQALKSFLASSKPFAKSHDAKNIARDLLKEL